MIRKIEHLFFCDNCKRTGVFNNVKLEPEELLGLSLEEIDTSVNFLDMKLSFPSYINAITGGSYISESVNRKLAILSREFDIPVMTGSMSVFFKIWRNKKLFASEKRIQSHREPERQKYSFRAFKMR